MTAGEVVDDVSVVPDDTEVRRGLHGRDPFDGLIRIGLTGGVRVLRDTEHALDFRVFRKLFDHIHVGARGSHRDRDELETEVLGDAEVAVIPGRRAQELATALDDPGFIPFPGAHGVALHEVVEHHVEARVAADDDLLDRNAEDLGEQASRLDEAHEVAVVQDILLLLRLQIGTGVDDVEHLDGGLFLFDRGLASGHVQVETLLHILVITGLKPVLLGLQFFTCHFGILFHGEPSFRKTANILQKISTLCNFTMKN